MILNRLIELVPVARYDKDGNEIERHVNALQAAKGNWGEAFRIASHCRMYVTEKDGTKWDWAVKDRDRLQRILELSEEMNEERALARYLRGYNYDVWRFKELPSGIESLLYADEQWEKNRWWQPRIDALKKTYYRPIQMLDKETGEVLGEWDSVRQCCMETGLRKGDISLILSGKRRLRSIKGYTFDYKFKKDRQRRDKELRDWKAGKREPWKMKKGRKR